MVLFYQKLNIVKLNKSINLRIPFHNVGTITPTVAFFNMLFEKMHDVSWTYFPSCFGITIGTWFTTQLIFSLFCLVFAKFRIILNLIKKLLHPSIARVPQMCVYITHWSNGCPPFAMCLWQWMYKTCDVMCHLICKTFCIRHSWGQLSREMKATTCVSFRQTQLLLTMLSFPRMEFTL